jgi:hypothetical protein
MRWRWALIGAALMLIVVWVGAMLLEQPTKVRPQLGWGIIDKTGEGFDPRSLSSRVRGLAMAIPTT